MALISVLLVYPCFVYILCCVFRIHLKRSEIFGYVTVVKFSVRFFVSVEVQVKIHFFAMEIFYVYRAHCD